MQALREIKNQIIGPGRRGGGRGGAGGARGLAGGARPGGGRGEDDGTRAVLAAAVVGHLTQVLAHHDEKVGSAAFTCSLLVSAGIWLVLGLKKSLFCGFVLNWEKICCVQKS